MPSLPKSIPAIPGRAALRLAAGTASLAVGRWALGAIRGTPEALGAGTGAIRAVTQGSANCRGGTFRNLEPDGGLNLDLEENRLVFFEVLAGGSESRPRKPIPMDSTPPPSVPSPLAVTWLGHATALVEIDGYRLLTDPVWSERCSPSSAVGPQRMHAPPVDVEALPVLDAVVISHDHYDHLDMHTVQTLARTQRAPFVVPLGVGAHLRKWGIPAERVVELDWNTSIAVGEITLVCTPARHFSGRFLSRNNTLWSSWAILGPRHRAFFGGDSGYTRSYAEIGSQHGPFDLALLPIGAYNKTWPDIHMNPEEAVQAHLDLNAGSADPDSSVLVPIHWATFRLAPHPWAEPAERLVTAARAAGIGVAAPRPGGRVVSGRHDPAVIDCWWRL